MIARMREVQPFDSVYSGNQFTTQLMPKYPGKKPEWLFIYNDTAYPLMSKKDAMEYFRVAIKKFTSDKLLLTCISKSMWKQEYVATNPVTRKGVSIVVCHKRVASPHFV